MTVVFSPHKMTGTITVPPSKSYSHRALICAALSKGTSHIYNIIYSDDIKATISALIALGAKIDCMENYCIVQGIATPPESVVIDCGESGSTYRFMLPICAALGVKTTFLGKGKLPSRPITPYIEEFSKNEIKFDFKDDNMPIISGKLQGNTYCLKGDISSQFFTGLFLALPLITKKFNDNEYTVILDGELESRPYVNMTINVLKHFGITVSEHYDNQNNQIKWVVSANDKYKNCDYTIEGDFSQAAFFAVAGAINSEMKIKGLPETSAQGDREILNIVQKCGAAVEYLNGVHIIKPPNGKLKPFEINVSDIPDLVPILAVLATFCDGVSKITGAARLRIKESDRLTAISDVINKLGGNVTEQSDGLIIKGVELLKGGTVDSYNDHRIAMSAAILATKCETSVTLTNAKTVEKSYPNFYETIGVVSRNERLRSNRSK